MKSYISSILVDLTELHEYFTNVGSSHTARTRLACLIVQESIVTLVVDIQCDETVPAIGTDPTPAAPVFTRRSVLQRAVYHNRSYRTPSSASAALW